MFLCLNFRVLGSWICFWLLRVGVGDFNFWGFGTVGHFRVFLVLDLDSWTLFWWHVWFSWFVRIHGVWFVWLSFRRMMDLVRVSVCLVVVLCFLWFILGTDTILGYVTWANFWLTPLFFQSVFWFNWEFRIYYVYEWMLLDICEFQLLFITVRILILFFYSSLGLFIK